MPIWGRSLCSVAGAIAGGLAGTVMGLAMAEPMSQEFSVSEALEAGLLLGAAGWLVLLIVLGAWLGYGVSKIAWPALANALLSSTLTVFICRALAASLFDTILGMLIGTLVGYVMCLLCGQYVATKGEANALPRPS